MTDPTNLSEPARRIECRRCKASSLSSETTSQTTICHKRKSFTMIKIRFVESETRTRAENATKRIGELSACMTRIGCVLFHDPQNLLTKQNHPVQSDDANAGKASPARPAKTHKVRRRSPCAIQRSGREKTETDLTSTFFRSACDLRRSTILSRLGLVSLRRRYRG